MSVSLLLHCALQHDTHTSSTHPHQHELQTLARTANTWTSALFVEARSAITYDICPWIANDWLSFSSHGLVELNQILRHWFKPVCSTHPNRRDLLIPFLLRDWLPRTDSKPITELGQVVFIDKSSVSWSIVLPKALKLSDATKIQKKTETVSFYSDH